MTDPTATEGQDHFDGSPTRAELVLIVLALEERLRHLASAVLSLLENSQQDALRSMKDYVATGDKVTKLINEIAHQEKTNG